MVATGTLRFIDGAETGGLDLAVATTGSPTVIGSIASPSGRSGAFHYRLTSITHSISLPPGFGSGGTALTTLAYDHGLIGFAFKTNAANSGETRILGVWDDGTPSLICSVHLDTSGNLIFRDSGGAQLAATSGTDYGDGSWHFVEFAWESVASSGAWEFWVNNSSIGSGSAGAFLTANIGTIALEDAVSLTGGIDHDDIYFVTHTSTLQGNNLGNAEVFAYQNQLASVTPDVGDDLDSGTGSSHWVNTGDTPYDGATWAGYAGTPLAGRNYTTEDAVSNNGHGKGPTGGAYSVTGTIQGAMWVGVYQRGNGGGTTHSMVTGNSTGASTWSMDAIDNSADSYRGRVGEANGSPDWVPSSSQSFAIGFQVIGAQDIECYEQWAFLLHTPSAGGPTAEPKRMALTGVGY